MTRTTRLLILAAALALLLALVATATAAPPDCKKKDPGCPTTPPATTVVPGSLGAGFSCEDYVKLNASDPNPRIGDPLTWDTEDSDTFVFKPGGDGELESGLDVCIDVSSKKSGSIEVKVDSFDGAKKNSTLYALVKDSHPGDHCGHAVDMPGSALNLNLASEDSGIIRAVPAATLNACGTGYSEAEVECDDSGCEAGEPKIARNGTPDPLALMLGITGRPGITTATVTITYTAGG